MKKYHELFWAKMNKYMTRYLKFCLVAFVFLLIRNISFGQQKVTVSGMVIDKETQLGRGDIDIILLGKKDRKIGTTMMDGTFTLIVDDGSKLKFMATGMDPLIKEVSSKDTGLLKLFMSPVQSAMKEVVVTGFKSVTRETMTGASTIISGKDIQDVPVSNITQLLQGKVAGLNVQVNNGMPGARTSMFLRGISSATVSGAGSSAFMTPTSPLFVVDGVQIDDNSNYSYGFDQAGPGVSPLSSIPPEDVQSIEVLKDAQATALYGSKGAYGVILITTKRGNSAVPIVQYTSSYFLNAIPKLRDVIGGRDERDLRIQQILQYDSTNAAALK